jgi:hypothetical protein
LGKIGDPRAVLALISNIRDDDFDVRWFAQWALKKITRQDFGNDQHAWRQWWIEQEVDSLPIRLSPTPTICSVHPFS